MQVLVDFKVIQKIAFPNLPGAIFCRFGCNLFGHLQCSLFFQNLLPFLSDKLLLLGHLRYPIRSSVVYTRHFALMLPSVAIRKWYLNSVELKWTFSTVFNIDYSENITIFCAANKNDDALQNFRYQYFTEQTAALPNSNLINPLHDSSVMVLGVS